MSVTNSDRAHVALYHLGILRDHLAFGPIEQPMVFDAVCMRLAAALEEAGKIDETRRRQAFGAMWTEMWATRNHIAHGYLAVNQGAIIDSVREDLDEFEAALRLIADGAPR